MILAERKRLTVKDIDDGSRTIVCRNGGGETLAALNEMRSKKHLCDVTFKMGDDFEIQAHKNILVANSDYFHAMFLEGFSESTAREISLQSESVNYASAQALIDFMYTSQLTMTADTVQDLIMAADLWQMSEVKRLCEEYMERLITEENCIGISQFAKVYTCPRLQQRSEQMLKQRFPLVAQGTEFLQLPSHNLQHVLSMKDLNLGPEGEDVVARALCRWLDSQAHLPPDTFTPLLQTVHWSATSPSCRGQLMTHPVLANNAEVQQQLQAMEGRGQAVRKAQTTLYVIGGYMQERTGPKYPRLNSVERLDPVIRSWWPCAPLPMKSSASLAFDLHGHMLVCACEPLELPNQRGNARARTTATRMDVFEYHPMRDEWVEAGDQWSVDAVERVNVCMQAEGAAAVCRQSGAIYTVSCQEAARISYHVLEGSVHCRDVGLLPRPHAFFTPQQRHFSVVVVERFLYVMGGDRRDAGSDPVPTARVIAFDLEDKVWLSKADMLEPRVQMASATLNGKIYVCGGFNTQRLASMEVYDPAADQWSALHPMYKFRSHHQLLVLHNTLWAIGGKSYVVINGGARKVLNMCEVYDPETDSWTEIEAYNMKNARCAFAAIAI